MKTIYIITPSFPPDSKVGALRPFRLAKHVTDAAWKAEIITNLPQVEYSHNWDLLNTLNSNTRIHHIFQSKSLNIDNHDSINRFFSTYKQRKNSIKKNRLIARLFGNFEDILNKALVPDIDILRVPFFLHKLSQAFNYNMKNIILTTSPPHSIHLTGLLFSKINKVPWVADFRDPWDSYPVTGNIEIANPLERIMERVVIENADAVISTTQTYNKNLINKHSDFDSNKFFTITNSFDESKVAVSVKTDPEKFVISYTGIFYPDKDPFTFFRALRSWFDKLDIKKKKKYKKILRVQLIGSQKITVGKIINGLNLNSVVRFIDRVPHDRAVQLTKASDMVLISSGIGKKSRPGWLPSKLFEYLGCRVPILAVCREGEMAKIIRETKSGYVIPSEDHKTIHSILEKEIERKLSGKKNTDFTFNGVECFEEKNVMPDMIKIIEKVLDNNS